MLRTTLGEISECEIQASKALMELKEIKSKLMGACDMESDERRTYEDREVPLAAYELQLERHLEEKKDLLDRHELEKDKMRKQYRTIVGWLAGVLIALLIGVFGTAIWFMNTYDIMSYSQDGNGLNNIANRTTQGDVIYEPESSDNTAQEP